VKAVFGALIVSLLLMSGCAGHHVQQEMQISNPYIEKAIRLNHSGVMMLAKRHPVRAGGMFRAAIKSATLADDAHWMALSWYNFGRAQAEFNDNKGARKAYGKVVQLAETAGDRVNEMRARLALALLGGEKRRDDERVLAAVDKSFPVDVQLAAGQLAAKFRLQKSSRQAFEQVLLLAGQNRTGLLYAARARLGLAGLDIAANDMDAAAGQINRALVLLHQAGSPELLKQALQLAARIQTDVRKKQRLMQRIDDISQAMTQRPHG